MSNMSKEKYTELEENDSEEEEWMEQEEAEDNQITCLFCKQVSASVEDVWEHCRNEHEFRIIEFARLWNMDSLQYIKFINYMRQKEITFKDLQSIRTDCSPPWLDDAFMQPFNLADLLLQYDIEDDLGIDDSGPSAEMGVKGDRIEFFPFNTNPANSHQEQCPQSLSANHKVSHQADNMQQNSGSSLDYIIPDVTSANQADDSVVLSKKNFEELCHRLQESQVREKQLVNQLQRALHDLSTLRCVAAEVLASSAEPAVMAENVIQNMAVEEEDIYFGSYSHFSIHEEMLKDKVRTESYRDFMYQNTDLFKDKIVLDVGCGTGILSMFAARAGAKLVIGVDQSDIIYHAIDIIRENELNDKVKLVKGRIEDVDLPVDKVDIIVSEWMGYFLLFESMLDSVLYARNKYLAPGGIVYPDKYMICLALLSDQDLYSQHVSFWGDVYGFKMNCMTDEVIKEAAVKVVDNSKIVSEQTVVKNLDICSCDLADLQFTSEFALTPSQNTDIHAVVGYFDTYFEKECQKKIMFSSGPHATPTHWKQTVFMLQHPIMASKGIDIQGKISVRKNRKDPRSLLIKLTLNDQVQTYLMQ